jgi:hypothetical protein
MKAFHFDFNTVLFRPETVEHYLHVLSELGFDTILWEVENAFEWQTCPECAVPDTLPIRELTRLLAVARSLGLENIPLMQTLGHCEYVLRNERYAHLREHGCIDQYCPLQPELLSFLERWMDEYLEVFDAPKYFHVGADETMQLGVCPDCRDYAAQHGVAGLYRKHMDPIIAMVRAKGARPLLWADMFLSHPESLSGLSHELILCDWGYERTDQASEVFLFEHGQFSADSAPASAVGAFGRHLYREGREPSQLNPWVAADYLQEQGFDLLLCPASSHAGDATYAPRMGLHLSNIGDTVAYASKLQARGTILTSWTWHLFPLTLQRGMMLYYIQAANTTRVDSADFLNAYGFSRLSLPRDAFADICALLETPCPLTDARQLGFFKGCLYRSVEKLEGFLADWQREGVLERMRDQAKLAEYAYRQASVRLAAVIGRPHTELAAWQLAARGLWVRAQSARCLLERNMDAGGGPAAPPDVSSLIRQERALRAEFLQAYLSDVLPHRAAEMVACQFDTIIEALQK